MKMLAVGVAVLCLGCVSAAGQNQCSEKFHQSKLALELKAHETAILVSKYDGNYKVVERVIREPREIIRQVIKYPAYACKFFEDPADCPAEKKTQVFIYTYSSGRSWNVGGSLALEAELPMILKFLSDINIQANISGDLSGNEIKTYSSELPMTPRQCHHQEVRIVETFFETSASADIQGDRWWWRVYDKKTGGIRHVNTSCGNGMLTAKEQTYSVVEIQHGPGKYGDVKCCEDDGWNFCCGCVLDD
ncbi:MAG: hypothetical protein AAF108_06190 [Planctomycetota bacterium]